VYLNEVHNNSHNKGSNNNRQKLIYSALETYGSPKNSGRRSPRGEILNLKSGFAMGGVATVNHSAANLSHKPLRYSSLNNKNKKGPSLDF
jgi:hypothetical protein